MATDHEYKQFRASLEPGDLVFANSYGVKVSHIVTLSKNNLLNRHGEPAGPNNWRGLALCGSDGNQYFWTAADPHSNEPFGVDVCKTCSTKWRSKGKPPIKGVTDFEVGDWEADPGKLPWAWKEVEASSLPHDPEEPDPGDRDHTRCEELRRWQRGDRIVRLVKLLDDPNYPYAVRFSAIGDDRDKWAHKSGAQECLSSALKLMAKGGIP